VLAPETPGHRGTTMKEDIIGLVSASPTFPDAEIPETLGAPSTVRHSLNQLEADGVLLWIRRPRGRRPIGVERTGTYLVRATSRFPGVTP